MQVCACQHLLHSLGERACLRPTRRTERALCVRSLRGTGHADESLGCQPVASIIDTVANLAKRRGLVFQSGEIYGGTKSAWDYGPLGVEFKENIKRQWWRSVVTGRDDVVGLDSAIILPREVWVASGHVEVFNDPLVECQNCHKRHRQDHLQEAYALKKGLDDPDAVPMTEIVCPDCGTKGQWTEPRDFNMMLKTYLGPIETEEGMHYLRPETAQGIFVNFANVVTTARKKPPFGIGQIGKSFRNEITPGNFIFRTREFEQMEMEFFVEPSTAAEWHQYWIDTRLQWYVDLGIDPDNLRLYEHPKEKLSHYSDRTVDIEYKFGFSGNPWGELEGVANRTDFDLSTHAKHSGVDLSFYDQATETRYVPYVIEPAAGLTRSLMAFLVDAYTEDEAPNAKGGVDKRTVLKLDPRLAPVKAAVLPLSRHADLSPKARDLAAELRTSWNVEFDDAGAIGRRYRRQDEIGTPFCVTLDFDSLEDHAVTIRERDAMTQERVALDAVSDYLAIRLRGA
jgi:glycyl-tRNA synthetase